MLRGIWGDPERYRDTYWSRFDGRYFAGDGAKRDAEGYFWLLGRVDDIMLVAGHNISTTEVESALVSHPAVAEAAVVGKTDDTTGQADRAFVILRGRQRAERRARRRAPRPRRRTHIGPIAKPKSILFTEDLPKTRSGKIMRRLLRNVAEDQAARRHTTLADPSVVDGIKVRGTSSHAGDRTRTESWFDAGTSRSTGRGATARSNRVRRCSSTSTACCPTPPRASTTSRRRAATGAASSTRAVTTR